MRFCISNISNAATADPGTTLKAPLVLNKINFTLSNSVLLLIPHTDRFLFYMR